MLIKTQGVFYNKKSILQRSNYHEKEALSFNNRQEIYRRMRWYRRVVCALIIIFLAGVPGIIVYAIVAFIVPDAPAYTPYEDANGQNNGQPPYNN